MPRSKAPPRVKGPYSERGGTRFRIRICEAAGHRDLYFSTKKEALTGIKEATRELPASAKGRSLGMVLDAYVADVQSPVLPPKSAGRREAIRGRAELFAKEGFRPGLGPETGRHDDHGGYKMMSSLVAVSVSRHRSVGSLWASESSRGPVTRICSAEPLRGLDGRKMLRPVSDELGVTLSVDVAAQCPTDPAENPSVAGFDGIQWVGEIMAVVFVAFNLRRRNDARGEKYAASGAG